MLIYVCIAIWTHDYFWAIVGLFCFLLTLSPAAIKRRFGVTLPWELNFLIILALFLHVGGNIGGWYDALFPWYDKIVHLISSIVVAIIGFIIAAILDRYVETIKMDRRMIIFFVIIFTMAAGALWEVGEFFYDMVFDTQLQVNLDDTMWDIVFDMIGGAIIGIFGNFYLRYAPEEHFY
jgi:uncharacterized membrane protein YjdF